jgi:heme-degrading monooxygenase HmoA
MHTRLTTFTGAEHIDEGVAYVRDVAIPVLAAQNGYRGVSVSHDRSNRIVSVLSLWATEADRDASDSALDKTRQEGLGVLGGTMTVENFEQVVAEIVKPPVAGSALTVTRVSMDPSVVDENIAFFTSTVLPQMKANAGFLALRNMIDRKSGKGIVGAAWADEASQQAAAADMQARRQQATDRGVTLEDMSFREILLSELP